MRSKGLDFDTVRNTLVHFEHLFGHYKRSKYLAEHEVLRAGATGLPVVLVHPTFPVGERDTALRLPGPAGQVGDSISEVTPVDTHDGETVIEGVY